jgi:hypothetical protein
MKEDWIFWNLLRRPSNDPSLPADYFTNVQNSAIAPYIGRFTAALFRCPADRDAPEREQKWRKSPSGSNPYLYSYSFTSYVEDNGGIRNRGMASLYGAGAPPLHFRAASITSPVQKFMLVEENSDDKQNESVIDDGRWVPPGNVLTGRHQFPRGQRVSAADFMRRGKASVAIADGHVDTVSPSQGQQRQSYDSMY